MVDNGLAESLALAGAARRFLERGDAHPERVAGNSDAAEIEANKRKLEPLVERADYRAPGHPCVDFEIGGVATALAHFVGDEIDDHAGCIDRKSTRLNSSH